MRLICKSSVHCNDYFKHVIKFLVKSQYLFLFSAPTFVPLICFEPHFSVLEVRGWRRSLARANRTSRSSRTISQFTKQAKPVCCTTTKRLRTSFLFCRWLWKKSKKLITLKVLDYLETRSDLSTNVPSKNYITPNLTQLNLT